MNPETLVDDADREMVSRALNTFYSDRPSAYEFGMDQSRWDHYVSVVTRCTKPGGRVLDLGSGSWHIPYALHKQGFDVDGCDVWSESYLAAQTRQMPAKGSRLRRYDGRNLPYPDETLDTVCSLTVSDHLLDVDGMLHQIDRVLRGGGRNIILSPNCAGPSGPVCALYSVLVRPDRTGAMRPFRMPSSAWQAVWPAQYRCGAPRGQSS